MDNSVIVNNNVLPKRRSARIIKNPKSIININDAKQSFESFVHEFKDTKESVLGVLKLVMEQQNVIYYYLLINTTHYS